MIDSLRLVKTMAVLLLFSLTTDTRDCIAQTTGPNHAFNFQIFPSSINLHAFDAPETLLILNRLVLARRGPSEFDLRFKWSTTIGRLQATSGVRNRFFTGHKAGHGQIAIEDSQTGKMVFVAVTITARPTLDTIMDEPIDLWRISDKPRNILFDLCLRLRSPCGIEVAIESAEDMLKGDVTTPGPHAGMRRATPLKHVTPREVLNRISTLSPNYTWTLSKGVINLIPKHGNGRKADQKSVLDGEVGAPLKIANLPTKEAMKLLFDQVGIKATAAPEFSRRLSLQDPVISLTCENESIRGCLNDMASADGQAIWSFVPKSGGEYYFDVSRWGGR